MAARVLALLLVLVVLPFTGEATEYVVHWVQDGDAVHGAHHPEDAQAPDEDGCPDGGHLCHLTACTCGGHLVAPIARATLPTPAAPIDLEAPAHPVLRGCGAPAPELRPPIA